MSLGVAMAVHAVLLAAFAIWVAASTAPAALPVVTLELQGGSDLGSETANPGGGTLSSGPQTPAASSATGPAAEVR